MLNLDFSISTEIYENLNKTKESDKYEFILPNFNIAKIFGINKLDQIPKDKRIYAGGNFSKGFSLYKAETLNQSNPSSIQYLHQEVCSLGYHDI